MLWSLNDLLGHKLDATDGEIGSLHDLLFDQTTSRIRYAVVDTGEWLPGKKVLIAPAVLGQPRSDASLVPVALTRQQIESSPPFEHEERITRADERRLHEHYGWEPYWDRPMAPAAVPFWGTGVVGPGLSEAPTRPIDETRTVSKLDEEPNLQSAGDVVGYYIEARDDDIGHVEDLLIEDESWTLRYIVVDTRNWLPGKQVVVSPQWLSWVSWSERKIGLDLPRDRIENSPEYRGVTLDRDYEERLHRHYDRPLDW